MRTSDAACLAAVVTLILLAGCERAAEDPRVAAGAIEQAPAGEAGRIACRPAGASQFSSDCTAERAAAGEGQLLTLRHRDGGFRRVILDADGRTILAADGAEAVAVTGLDGALEIAVAGDRYRLPAR